ncbi:uncharacterized protein EDB91DRAFT_1160217, partial [Suillus paluster]|uniref:uncharacterized protein n=1 Tax=Suillus paluster TaxID=48578 RepID=UPI001B87577F
MVPSITASFPVASTSSSSRPAHVNQGSFPVASIIILAITIIGMGALVVCVFLRNRSSARIKRGSLTVDKDKPSPVNKPWSRVLSWFSKSRRWWSETKSNTKHKRGDMTTISALHATCTFVAAAPSKFFAPPVVMQFRVPDTEKFVMLCSVCCPLSAHHTCHDPNPRVSGSHSHNPTTTYTTKVQSTFVDIPHLAQQSEQLPVSQQPSNIPERAPYSVNISSSGQDRSCTIEPHQDQPQSSSASPKWPKRTLAREDLPVFFVKTSL